MLDTAYVDDGSVMRRLWEMDLDLLRKEDIQQEYNLLKETCCSSCRRRFEFLVDWDHLEALNRHDCQFLSTTSIIRGNDTTYALDFKMILKAGMTHFPQHLGFLFCSTVKLTMV